MPKVTIAHQFLALMASLGVAKVIADSLWQSLLTHYQAPQRFYHNVSHIQALIKHFDQVKNDLNFPNTVLLAIFYHNSIYDPTRTDNELKSAELLETDLSGLIDSKILANVTWEIGQLNRSSYRV